MGILKPISRNRDMGVFFYLKFRETPKKGLYSDIVFLSFFEISQLSIVFNESVIVQYTRY